MGHAKEELMRRQEQRWSPTNDDRNVCANCFDDRGLKKVIVTTGSNVGCGFCKDSGSKKRKSIDVDSMIEFIASRINAEYGTPDETLLWDSEDKQYLGHQSIEDIESILQDLVESPHEDLLKLIISAFNNDSGWVHVDALNGQNANFMTSLWKQFSDQVKHKKRFFFDRPNKMSVSKILKDGASSPAEILTAISGFAKSIGLFVEIEQDLSLYRARKFSKTEPPAFTLEKFGVPNLEVSKKYANRMSPAGIPIFYGSDSVTTAAQEVARESGDTTGMTKFRTAKKLLVLDLTKIPDPPSIFEESNWHLRQAISFLNHFRREIMKPVERDGHEHVEYIPSQIFTEFIRHRVKFKKRKIDGVVFPSLQNTKGKNFALFCDNSLIAEKKTADDQYFLRYYGPPTIYSPKT